MADEVGGGQPNNMYMTIGIVVVLVAVVAIAAFMLMRPTEVEEEAATVEIEEETTAVVPTTSPRPSVSPSASPGAPTSPTVGQVKSFTVAASNFKFDPSEIRVKAGDTVKITLTNNGPMSHDWRVDAFSAGTKVLPMGQTETIEFVANKTGTFEYYCSVGTHRQMGMVGKLIVE